MGSEGVGEPGVAEDPWGRFEFALARSTARVRRPLSRISGSGDPPNEQGERVEVGRSCPPRPSARCCIPWPET